MCFIEALIGVFDSPDEAVGGVGGAAGMKSDGMHATVAMMATINTMFGIDPRKGLMSWASCVIPSVLRFRGQDKSNLQRRRTDLQG